MSKKINKKAIGDVVKALCDNISEESKKKYAELLKNVEEDVRGPDDFNNMFMYPITKAADIVVATQNEKITRGTAYKISFLWTNYDFIRMNFEKLATVMDGHACCADKSRYLVGRLADYYAGKTRKIDVKKKKKAFWVPHFWNDNGGEEWIEFFEALYALHYGDNVKYILFLNERYVPLMRGIKKHHRKLKAEGEAYHKKQVEKTKKSASYKKIINFIDRTVKRSRSAIAWSHKETFNMFGGVNSLKLTITMKRGVRNISKVYSGVYNDNMSPSDWKKSKDRPHGVDKIYFDIKEDSKTWFNK